MRGCCSHASSVGKILNTSSMLPPGDKRECDREPPPLRLRSADPKAFSLQDRSSMSIEISLPPVWGNEAAATVLVVLTYWLTVLVYRWHNVVRPNRLLFQAEFQNTQDRLNIRSSQVATGSDDAKIIAQVQNLLNQTNEYGWFGLWDFFFWARGQVLAAWQNLHDADRELAAVLSDADVRSRLVSIDIAKIDRPGAAALAKEVENALAAKTPDSTYLRALLWQALKLQYDYMETYYLQGINWQNKLTWLNAAGLLFIVVIAFTVAAVNENVVLLLMGAIGGLLGRLARSMNTQTDPAAGVSAEKGAWWAMLFMSPITGALSGWGGVLLIKLLADQGVLGAAFKNVMWGGPTRDVLTLGLALLLGFSERLFDEIASAVEKLAAPKPGGGSGNGGGGAAGAGGGGGAPAPAGHGPPAPAAPVPAAPAPAAPAPAAPAPAAPAPAAPAPAAPAPAAPAPAAPAPAAPAPAAPAPAGSFHCSYIWDDNAGEWMPDEKCPEGFECKPSFDLKKRPQPYDPSREYVLLIDCTPKTGTSRL
jgi:hypothetical protein